MPSVVSVKHTEHCGPGGRLIVTDWHWTSKLKLEADIRAAAKLVDDGRWRFLIITDWLAL